MAWMSFAKMNNSDLNMVEREGQLALDAVGWRGRFLRRIPVGLRGKGRLARALLRHRIPSGAWIVQDRLGLLYRVPDLHEPVAFQLLVDGVYEPDILECLLANLRPGATYVDVGANVGDQALPIARRVGPNGRVLAIEASAQVYACLCSNCKMNRLENVTCVNAAACETNGEILFYPAPADHFGMGAMAAQFEATPVSVRGAQLDKLLAEAKLDRADVLKLDVEGFELKVFQGAQALLTNARPPLILFEFCDWGEKRVPGVQVGDAQRFLAELGYSIWRLADFVCHGDPLREVVTTGFHTFVASRRKER
jgi:FkbM family methyltransferase